MKFEFGMVIAIDYLPDTRVMVVGPAKETSSARNWWAIVLRDEPAEWEVGEMITLSPDNAGLRIVDTSEGTAE